MRRMLVLALVMSLAFGSLATAEAAKKKKKKKKAKPVATTLFMHGVRPSGEIDGMEWLVDAAAGDGGDAYVMRMDATEPDGSTKSMGWHAESVVPWNTECTGLPVGFPTWIGDLQGRIVGDVKLKVFGSGNAETITARLWTDVAVFTCNENYVPPVAEAEVESASGEFEVVFPGVDATAQSHILVEFLGPSPSFGRVEYDGADTATQIGFGCFPPAGAKSCVPPPAEEE